MQQEIGSWSRTLTAIALAIGISFSGAASLAAQSDNSDDTTESRAYLYEGNTSDLSNATMLVEIDDLDDNYDDDLDQGINDDDADDVSDDDWDDDVNDDASDDDWDDDVNDDVSDDDWDDDVNDDVSDDDWDDDVNDDVSDDDWDDDVNDDVSDNDWDDDADDGWDDDADDDGMDDFAGSGFNLEGKGGTFRFQTQHEADDDDHWAVLGNGQERPAGLLTTEDEIDNDYNLTVQTLVDGEYMIVVHEDGNTNSPVLAAGDISGIVDNGTILVELEEVDGSGFAGRAFVQPEDADDLFELDVTVGIFPVGTVTPLNTPAPRG